MYVERITIEKLRHVQLTWTLRRICGWHVIIGETVGELFLLRASCWRSSDAAGAGPAADGRCCAVVRLGSVAVDVGWAAVRPGGGVSARTPRRRAAPAGSSTLMSRWRGRRAAATHGAASRLVLGGVRNVPPLLGGYSSSLGLVAYPRLPGPDVFGEVTCSRGADVAARAPRKKLEGRWTRALDGGHSSTRTGSCPTATGSTRSPRPASSSSTPRAPSSRSSCSATASAPCSA